MVESPPCKSLKHPAVRRCPRSSRPARHSPRVKPTVYRSRCPTSVRYPCIIPWSGWVPIGAFFFFGQGLLRLIYLERDAAALLDGTIVAVLFTVSIDRHIDQSAVVFCSSRELSPSQMYETAEVECHSDSDLRVERP
ncbi:hypothetical protein BDW02DRAFT_320588 [Decorospora gaudefroyi]|uniref:Uncharacterized protein n=1 Tax=Decorospora gaudefroyi TaxID=184978 RepID=A0A6A5KF66_9PLEO|nr:hypothetical protein BDW02DRAFT_320588 [Decorospora gaudefroyi]